MTQLYEENFGNALGSALGNGVQVFQQRQDQLDEKNYTRGQAKTANQKQEAQTLYKYLEDLTGKFRDVQGKGGQQGMSTLEISQAGDSLNKANKIMGLLTSGKYDEAQQAFGDFQSHMDAVAGPGPTDSSGAAVSGPAAPVVGTGTFSSADILNNQIGAGTQKLGGLALRGTEATVSGLETSLQLNQEQLAQVKATSASTIEALNATNGVQVATAKIFADLVSFNSAAQKATYLKAIADSGAAGAALVDGLNIPPELKAAVKKQAGNVQTRDDASAASALLDNDFKVFNLGDVKTKAPLVYTGMLLSNIGAMKDNEIKDADLVKMGTDQQRAQAELDNYRLDAPLEHSLLQQKLDTGKVNLTVLQATQKGEIDATNARNFGEMAKKGNVSPEYWDSLGKEINPATGKPWLTPALVESYKKLTELGKSTSLAELQILQGNAKTSTIAGTVAEQTQGAQVDNIKFGAKLTETQARAAGIDLQFRAKSGALTVQGQRLDNQGKANANFSSGVANKYADQMAQATLKGTQGDAASRVAAGTVATATVGTEIAGAKAKLQGALLDNTGKALTNNLVRATFAAQVKKYSLDNELTSSNIASNYFQIARSKALLPGEIAAQGAALEYNKAQAAGLLKAASDKGDRAEQTKILQQQRIISDGDLKDAQLAIGRLIPSAKFGVDQFDPSNYSTMTAKLDENQKKQLSDAILQYNDVMKARKDINGELSKLRTGNASSPIPQGRAGFQAVYDLAKEAGDPHPEIVAAQWALESGYGKSASGKNNLFGIKAAGGQAGTSTSTTEFVNGKSVATTATFADYDSPLAGIQARVDFMNQNPRYAKAGYQTATTPGQAAAALQQAGYATDPQYSSKLIAIMKANGYNPDDKSGGTLQSVKDTTPAASPASPPVPAPLQKGDFRSSGGGVYSSPTLQVSQWQNLDKTGFFKAVQKMNPNDSAGVGTLLKKYSLQLFGGDWENHMSDLAQVAKQVIGK